MWLVRSRGCVMHVPVPSSDGEAADAHASNFSGLGTYALFQGAFLVIIFFRLYFEHFIGNLQITELSKFI